MICLSGWEFENSVGMFCYLLAIFLEMFLLLRDAALLLCGWVLGKRKISYISVVVICYRLGGVLGFLKRLIWLRRIVWGHLIGLYSILSYL